MAICSVPICARVGGHRFPRDEETRKKWVVAIKRQQPNSAKLWIPGPASRVCSEHFVPYTETLLGKNRSLKPGAVPSVFSFRKKTALDTARDQRIIKRSINQHFLHVENESPASDLNTQLEEVIPLPDLSLEAVEPTSEQTFHKSVSTQCGSYPQETNKRSFLEELKDDPTAMQYYTGFTNYKHFDLLFRALGIAASNLRYNCNSLAPREQLLLTLTKLRQAKDDYELSRFFHISETTVRQVFSTWVDFMYYQFKEIDIWPGDETIKHHMPLDFKKKFPNTRVILDANIDKSNRSKRNIFIV